ncbi:MAG: hypothetical protein OXK82_04010 [Deltaproteobacteria bacterium]|nr:hypothetical protein [Deltaproteobacteria bacterium]MDE0342328.1 hypothetical protein [Deltaproteobacteria bacterium]
MLAVSSEPHTLLGVFGILAAVFGTGIALAVLILPDLRSMKRDIADLRVRMARLEGLFDGFTRRAGKTDVVS